MKAITLSLFLASSVLAKDFGAKNGSNWIVCSENTNCGDADHMNNTDAVCVRRMLKQISNDQSAGYINAKNVDAQLGREFINTVVSRCMTNADKDLWLEQNMVKDTTTSITASYSYVPYLPPEENNNNTGGGSSGGSTDTTTTDTTAKVQLYKTCDQGDDQACKDWFGVSGTHTALCCWKAELVDVPSSYSDSS